MKVSVRKRFKNCHFFLPMINKINFRRKKKKLLKRQRFFRDRSCMYVWKQLSSPSSLFQLFLLFFIVVKITPSTYTWNWKKKFKFFLLSIACFSLLFAKNKRKTLVHFWLFNKKNLVFLKCFHLTWGWRFKNKAKKPNLDPKPFYHSQKLMKIWC